MTEGITHNAPQKANVSEIANREKRCPHCDTKKKGSEFYGVESGKLSDYCRECWPIVRKKYASKPRKSTRDPNKRPKRTEQDKYCKKCNDWRPLSEFYEIAGGRLSGYCRVHQNQYRKDLRRAKNPPQENGRRRTSTTNRPEPKEEGTKWCPQCEEFRPEGDFYFRGPNTHLRTSYCKTHHNQRNKENTTPLE